MQQLQRSVGRRIRCFLFFKQRTAYEIGVRLVGSEMGISGRFRSLSRLKQLVIGKKTREDHPQVMNACVRLYADAANAKTKLENGFDLSDYDERTLKFAFDYSEKLLAIDVNIEINQMLDTAWSLFAKYFTREEVAIKEELIKKYWKEA